MQTSIALSKSDVRRALVRHHFTPCTSNIEVFNRLRSIQFDPIAPVGCNHDLVLQARVPGYKIGAWEKTAYKERLVYDGWDKCASLVPMEGWPVRRIFHERQRPWFEEKIFTEHKEAVEIILSEIRDRGPLMPKECEFQQRREEWKVSWYGPSVTKQALRALWHSGIVMTAGRKKGQHLYDLTERVVPGHIYTQPRYDDLDAIRELILERHRAMGILRPSAAAEVWSYPVLTPAKLPSISELVRRGDILPVDVEGVKAHATPAFLSLLDQPSLEPRVIFVAPLDQFMWDRKMIGHLFDYDYTWEIYVPEPKRKWGYYVLPVLFGDQLVARVEFYCRDGNLEVREWLFEDAKPPRQFWPALKRATKDFMKYCSATRTAARDHIDPRIKDLLQSISA